MLTRAFRNSARDALDALDSNGRHHILRKSHNWSRLSPDPPKWNDVYPYLLTAMQSDKSRERLINKSLNQFERAYTFFSGEFGTVVVRFIKDKDGLVRWISTGYTR